VHRHKNAVLKWLEVIIRERFSNVFSLIENEDGVCLRIDGAVGRIVFNGFIPEFYQARSDLPITYWKSDNEGWRSALGLPLPAPGTCSLPTPLIERNIGKYIINYDVLGLAYWMLARVEEIERTDLDEHSRFPAKSSHAYKHNYLARPIVDEWLYILHQVIQRQWPRIELKRHSFAVGLSHDVDMISRYAFAKPLQLVRRLGGDFLRRGNFRGSLLPLWLRLKNDKKLHAADTANTFDWIMDVSERNNFISSFYFACPNTRKIIYADYEIEHPIVIELMRRIHRRGHEIGLHPSYGIQSDPQAITAEASRLRKACVREGIEQEQWGGRMHYLCWRHPITLYGWEQAGMSYDSTLSYADMPGFRCGTCFEYPAFDPVNDKIFNLRIRPLIAMECSVMGKRYMGLGVTEAAFQKFVELKRTCKAVNGLFTLLWHNTELDNIEKKRMYQNIIEYDR